MMRRMAIAAAVAAGMAAPVLAQENPTVIVGDGIIRLEPAENVRSEMPVVKEKGAFLGLTTSPPNATMREQLKLPRGTGLVVDFIEKDSPADAAGLKPHDILTKLDDQVLVNFQQLAVLVRMHNPGDTVKLTYVRQGETKTADAKLIEKEVPVLHDENPWMMPVPGHGMLPPGMFEKLPQGDGWRSGSRIRVETQADGSTVRTLTEKDRTLRLTITKEGQKTLVIDEGDKKGVFSGPVDTREQLNTLPEGAAEQLQRLEARRMPMDLEMRQMQESKTTAEGAAASASTSDGEHTLTLTIDRTGNKHLLARDAKGAVLFDGPLNSPDDRAKLPLAIVKKVEKMEASVMIK